MRRFESNGTSCQHRRRLANLLLAALLLCPNMASATTPRPGSFTHDDIMEDFALSLEEHDQLKDELLPIVHECPGLAVTIRAQDIAKYRLAKGCAILKETEEHFHATLQTDPASPLRGEELEMLAFSDPNDMNEYWKTVYSGGRDAGFAGTYLFRRSDWTTAVALLGGAGYGIWAHEYVHHLDWTFNQTYYCTYWWGGKAYLNLGPFEALAEYITNRDFGAAVSLIGDGSNLPDLLDAWRYWEHDDQGKFQYGWGYLIVRFLFEEHPQVILKLYDMIRMVSCSDHNVFWNLQSYADEALPPLNDDFHRWARSFANLTRVRQIEPITLFVDDDGIRVRDILDNFVSLVWRRYFHTSRQDLTMSVSFSTPDVADLAPSTRWEIWVVVPIDIGSVDVTVTLTAPDGESAQQTFTVNVARDAHWQLKPIVLRDPVSTEEGYQAVNLATYFTGAAVEESEFVVESHNPDVALAEVRDGYLVITAVSVGETEVTVRGDYHGRVGEQTFTIVVTNACPPWLCERSFSTGWRSALLQQAADAANRQAESEVTHPR